MVSSTGFSCVSISKAGAMTRYYEVDREKSEGEYREEDVCENKNVVSASSAYYGATGDASHAPLEHSTS